MLVLGRDRCVECHWLDQKSAFLRGLLLLRFLWLLLL